MRNRTENQMTIALIRHGTTASNRERRYLGRTDEGLDSEGIRELLHLKEKGYYPEADRLFISPMQRCRETAGIIYPEMKYTELPQWREMDFGEFEGKNYKELSGNPDYQRWIDSGGVLPFPGGESRDEFVKRCADGFALLREMLSEETEMPKKIACVVHGGTIMALLSHYLGGEYFDYRISNGGVYLWVPSGSSAWRPHVAPASDPADRESHSEA